MKKLIILICCCCVLCLPADAQGLLKRLTGVGRKTTSSSFNRKLPQQTRRVAPVLNRRAEAARAEAVQMQQAITTPHTRVPKDIVHGPVNEVFLGSVDDMRLLQQTHPQHPYLQGTGALVEQNITNYLSAAHNRLYTQFAKSIQEREPRVPEIMQQVQQQTAALPKPENPAAWLAQQVPADTHVLVVGEGFYHNPSTVDAATAFLPELRKQMPNRPIIMLSDFLEEKVVWTPELDRTAAEHPGYEPLWQSAHAQNIQVIGIQNPLLQGFTASFYGMDDTGLPASRDWEGSFEAMEFAGQDIQQKLAEVQSQNPDALIVLHIDQWQGSYNLPFSLVNKLAAQEPKLYVTAITSQTTLQLYHPFPGEEAERLSTRTTLFEQMYQQASLPDEGVVSRNLAKDVGTDAWIKIPFDPAKTDTGQY